MLDVLSTQSPGSPSGQDTAGGLRVGVVRAFPSALPGS
jgi:hypothetical protein